MRFKLFIGFLALCIISLGLWAFWFEPANFVTTNTTIALKAWPADCDNLKIVVLSDLHVGSPHNDLANLAKVVAATNSIHADLILLAGDFLIHEVIGGTFVKPEPIADTLQALNAPQGVYAVLGNHDWWYSANKMKTALEKANIPVLENKSKPIVKGACHYWLAGIGDYWMGQHNIGKALASIPDNTAILAFTHNPDIFYELPDAIALTFAGHTHGGQVNLPLLGRKIVPSQYGDKFALGYITEANKHLFVTTGIGTSIIPVRFRVPPEISVITLKSTLPI